MTPRKTKFIWALFLIDVALCIVIWHFLPPHRVINLTTGCPEPYQWVNPGSFLSLSSAVLLASVGVFLIVDAFHQWRPAN